MRKETLPLLLTRRDVLRSAGAVVPGVSKWWIPGGRQRPYFPDSGDWQALSPKEAGMDPDGIEEAAQYAARHNSTGLVILRGGRIVAERYWQDWTAETSQPIFSSSKSITAILIGMAVEERLLKGVGQSASAFLPAWKGMAKEAITIRHILSMTSGMKAGPARVSADIDAFEETAAYPLEHKPGEHWAYNTPVYRMLLRIIELAAGESINRYTQRKLAVPLGMQASSWDCPPGPEGRTNCTWYRSCLRDMSKFGQLILRNGKWGDKQLISARFVKEATSTSQKLNEAYGYLWWLNGKSSFMLAGGNSGRGMLWPDCPSDAIGALGALDKKIYIVPSLDLVIARHGGASGVSRSPGEEGGGRTSFDNELLGRICRAVRR